MGRKWPEPKEEEKWDHEKGLKKQVKRVFDQNIVFYMWILIEIMDFFTARSRTFI